MCKSCARHRGSAPDIPARSIQRAQSEAGMAMISSSEEEDNGEEDDDDEVMKVIVIPDDDDDETSGPKRFKSTVFLSKSFSEVTTGRPSQHQDTSVPREGEWCVSQTWSVVCYCAISCYYDTCYTCYIMGDMR